jgi:hypothetical protein
MPMTTDQLTREMIDMVNKDPFVGTSYESVFDDDPAALWVSRPAAG